MVAVREEHLRLMGFSVMHAAVCYGRLRPAAAGGVGANGLMKLTEKVDLPVAGGFMREGRALPNSECSLLPVVKT